MNSFKLPVWVAGDAEPAGGSAIPYLVQQTILTFEIIKIQG
jgi:hypothetical protein